MNAATALAKHTAPGQYLGFAIQPVRLCYHLLTCDPGASVSLEYVDDVAIHLPDGRLIREQSKSAISNQNPLSDWANDFWKTIAYWMQDTADNIAASRFQYYVTPIKPGVMTKALSAATTKQEVTSITEAIRAAAKRKRKPLGCMPHLQVFLNATDDERAALITRMTVVSVDDDPVEPLRKYFAVLGSPALIEDVCRAVIGFAKEEADSLIRQRKPAIIDAGTFQRKVFAYAKKVNWPGLLSSFAPVPEHGTVANVLSTRPTFIRQLELIKSTPDELVRAVSDFLRTSADKSDWAERGLIFEQSLDEWDDNLIRQHSAIRGEIEDTASGKSAEVRGRIVYHRCAALQPPLEGRVVPGHFVHGCFNSLADSLRIGWHPNYVTMLGQGN